MQFSRSNKSYSILSRIRMSKISSDSESRNLSDSKAGCVSLAVSALAGWLKLDAQRRVELQRVEPDVHLSYFSSAPDVTCLKSQCWIN